MVKVTLKKGKEFPVRKFHPWIFSGAVADVQGAPEPGDSVEVYSAEGQFLASGYWNDGGISIKIYSFKKAAFDQELLKERFQNAKQHRQNLGLFNNENTDAFRLINAEGDGVPGLIVDLYSLSAVVQFQTAALWRYADDVLSVIDEVMPNLQNIVARSSEKGEVLRGSAESAVISEAGLRFKVDLVSGQKTGFFLDQRDNRELIRNLCGDKNVLNAFSYTGGFTISALTGGARHVTSVDASTSAMELLAENLRLNKLGENHTAATEDFFEFIRSTDEEYDVIVLDPPAFTKHRDAVQNALKGYSNINHQAMIKLRPGGVLFTFSCSQLVSRGDFLDALILAASRAGKHFRVVRELHASACHPVNLAHPEGEYLKGFWLALY